MGRKKDTTRRGRERRQQDEDQAASSSSKRRKLPPATTVDLGLEVLNCTICYSPLKPPVFQCAFGHVVCSCCHGKLPGDKCHMCAAGPAVACYNRCFALEHVLESLRVPCAHAGSGCAARMAYHDKEAHEAACPHAPCFCPEPGCGFAGAPPPLLLGHLVSLHDWPCSVFRFDRPLDVPAMVPGARVLRNVDDDEADDADRRVFFLLVMRPAPPLGLAVNVVCVEPHPAARPRFFCYLHYTYNATHGGQLFFSDPRIRSTNLSDGMPSDAGSFPFVVPDPSSRLARGGGSLRVTIKKVNGPVAAV